MLVNPRNNNVTSFPLVSTKLLVSKKKSMQSMTLLDLPTKKQGMVNNYRRFFKYRFVFEFQSVLDIFCQCSGCHIMFVQNAFLHVFSSKVTCSGV